MPTRRQKGPCRTCEFSELASSAVLVCTEGPPSAAALKVIDGKIAGNDGLNFFFPQMSIDHTGCWRWQKATKKKVLPGMPVKK